MKILSLFDGASCGQLAAQRANINIESYYASEIDKYAINVTQHHFPDTIQIGDATKVSGYDYPGFDLIMGGSPCTSFSSGGKREGFKGESGLFYEFDRIVKEAKPKYFLLENVIMKKEWEDEITKQLGVNPVEINSALVSAQNRRRLYWANFPISQPKDKGINLVDILDDKEYFNPAMIVGRPLNEDGVRDDKGGWPYIQCIEVKKKNLNKSFCLTQIQKTSALSRLGSGRHPHAFEDRRDDWRYYTLKELCRLQTMPEDYFDDIVSVSRASSMIGLGWTVDVITHILEEMLKFDKNRVDKTDLVWQYC